MNREEKAKRTLRERLRTRRESRKQRTAERARLAAENPVPRNARQHAYDNGPPFGPGSA